MILWYYHTVLWLAREETERLPWRWEGGGEGVRRAQFFCVFVPRRTIYNHVSVNRQIVLSVVGEVGEGGGGGYVSIFAMHTRRVPHF